MMKVMKRLVEIWAGVHAHASGGLWLEEERTLLLADLHLGYGWAQRRRGQLGPLADQETSARLAVVMEEMKPEQLVLLGDIIHAPKPAPEERDWIRATLDGLAARTRLICLRGNHDRDVEGVPPIEYPLLEGWASEQMTGLRAIHGDRLPVALKQGERLIVGHHHPAIAIEDASGARRRVPAFLIAGAIVVLPAFSPFAAGLNVWRSIPEEIAALGGPGVEPEVIAVTGKQAVALGPLSRLWSPGEGAYPERFRGPSRRERM